MDKAGIPTLGIKYRESKAPYTPVQSNIEVAIE